MAEAETTGSDSPSTLIEARIRDLGDWRGETLARVRALIRQADPDVVEEWKWRGVPVWSHAGIICTGETYKAVVKLTFAKGASLPDPAGLFNASLEGNTRRAIDIPEGGALEALKLAVTKPEEVFGPLDLPKRMRAELERLVQAKLKPKVRKYETEVSVRCNTIAGVESIKEVLLAAQVASQGQVIITVKASPLT